MRPLDLAILALYLVGVTVFGCSFYFRKSAKGTAGFVAGGGKVPSWAIVSIFSDPFLAKELAWKGGTALHKLYLKPQARYC